MQGPEILEGLPGRWACRRDAQGEWDLCILVVPRFCWKRLNSAAPALPLRVSAHQPPVGASPLLLLGNGRFLSGAAVKAAQTQPAFIITLWREPEHRAFPEMPVWNENNLKILHFYLFSRITSLCCSPPPLSLTQVFFVSNLHLHVLYRERSLVSRELSLLCSAM